MIGKSKKKSSRKSSESSDKPYNGGYIRPTEHGTFRAEVTHLYRRYRKTLPTEPQARGWIDQIQIDLANNTEPDSSFDIRDATRAHALLPAGVTLTDAVRDYAERHRSAPSVSLQDAYAQFMADKQSIGLRPRSMESLRHRLSNLVKEFGTVPISEIRGDVLIDWLARRKVKGESRGNYRRAWTNLFNWCIAAGWIERNPAAMISKPRADDSPPGILTVPQCKALLAAAMSYAPNLALYLATGLFAGLRPGELSRLTGAAFTPEHVHVGAQTAKTRQQRYVVMLPVLAAWVAAYPPGPRTRITPRRIYDRIRALRIVAGVQDWPSDGLRHSFASYHLALYQDAAKTAHELGHRSTAMLFQHYRNLVTAADAEQYFALTPDACLGADLSKHLSRPKPRPARKSRKSL